MTFLLSCSVAHGIAKFDTDLILSDKEVTMFYALVVLVLTPATPIPDPGPELIAPPKGPHPLLVMMARFIITTDWKVETWDQETINTAWRLWHEKVSHTFKEAMHYAAVELEISSPGEQWRFSSLYHYLQAYQETKDCPRVGEGWWLPSPAVCTELMTFNREYLKNLEIGKSIYLHKQAAYGQVITETNQCYNAYDWARDAVQPYHNVNTRRKALGRLKDIIGEKAFYEGRMPPHVPIWRFEEIK
jgi:hypothetical protein